MVWVGVAERPPRGIAQRFGSEVRGNQRYLSKRRENNHLSIPRKRPVTKEKEAGRAGR